MTNVAYRFPGSTRVPVLCHPEPVEGSGFEGLSEVPDPSTPLRFAQNDCYRCLI
jgi:hypothetical protein